MSLILPLSRGIRIATTLALALGTTAAAGLAGATSAPAVATSFIAAPNGMVGVPETITIKAPAAGRQVVTIGLTLGAAAQTLKTTIGGNGFGSVRWTHGGAGPWSISGLGRIATAATPTVVAMPTYTVLLAQNAVQKGVNNNLLAAVVAPIGSSAPTGSVTLINPGGAAIVTAPLSGLSGSAASTATAPLEPIRRRADRYPGHLPTGVGRATHLNESNVPAEFEHRAHQRRRDPAMGAAEQLHPRDVRQLQGQEARFQWHKSPDRQRPAGLVHRAANLHEYEGIRDSGRRERFRNDRALQRAGSLRDSGGDSAGPRCRTVPGHRDLARQCPAHARQRDLYDHRAQAAEEGVAPSSFEGRGAGSFSPRRGSQRSSRTPVGVSRP
jgi:hypothetical protein